MNHDPAFFIHQTKKIEPIPDPFDQNDLPKCQE